jgi:hypothetical protein
MDLLGKEVYPGIDQSDRRQPWNLRWFNKSGSFTREKD